MEVKPSKRAIFVWFFEKGPFLTFITIFCMYVVFTSIETLPYVYNSHESVATFAMVLFGLSLASLLYEYRTKKYYILDANIRVRGAFGVNKTRFDEIRADS